MKRLLFVFAAALVVACKALTPAEEGRVAVDGVQLSTCAALAHLCKETSGDAGTGKCWTEFDACLARYGYADAAPEAEQKPLQAEAPADAGQDADASDDAEGGK